MLSIGAHVKKKKSITKSGKNSKSYLPDKNSTWFYALSKKKELVFVVNSICMIIVDIVWDTLEV